MSSRDWVSAHIKRNQAIAQVWLQSGESPLSEVVEQLPVLLDFLGARFQLGREQRSLLFEFLDRALALVDFAFAELDFSRRPAQPLLLGQEPISAQGRRSSGK